jgi:hypothetical protein
MRIYERVSNKIRRDSGFKANGGVFLPQSRMRHIRWEEAVKHSQNNRSKGTRHYIKGMQFVHWDCTCGDIECLANPRPSGR